MKLILLFIAISFAFYLRPAQAEQEERPLFRPNSFLFYSFQAGSTTEIDNLKVVDLDSETVVYENTFEEPEDATRGLRLLYWPEGGRDSTNYFLNNSTFARVENGKLILETTGFNQNGAGGYDSHTDAEFTGTLPKNFHIEFEARRLQWAGHFDFHLYRAEPTDAPTGTRTLGGAFSAQRPSQKPADTVVMNAEGSWFNPFRIIPDLSNQNEFISHLIPAPEGSLEETRKLGVSLQDDLLTFYIDGNVVGSITVPDYSLQRDSDGDGVKDGREYDDGTDPYDASSFHWNYAFEPKHVDDSGAEEFLHSTENVRKYTEWQNPPITYWGPMENRVEGRMVYKFPFDGVATRIRLTARDASWDFFNEPGGEGRGCSMLEASRDGIHWHVLRNNLEPRQWGVDWAIDEDLPKELSGTGELWIRVRMLTEDAPNSFYTVAQFGRNTSESTEPFFSVKALINNELVPSEDEDGDGLTNAEELALKTNPFHADTNSDGFTDSEAMSAGLNPITDFSSLLALMKQLSTTSPGRFDLYTSDAIMDMNLGTLMIQKVGSIAKVDLQLQTTTNLATQPFTNLGEPIEVQVEMPGDKGFIRVHALGSN